jgi:hypothetical protein
MKQFDFKNINKRDVLFACAIILLTAFLLFIPSRIGGKGTSPAMSALNAIQLVSNYTDITYEQYEPRIIIVLVKSLLRDLDNGGVAFWEKYVAERYGR